MFLGQIGVSHDFLFEKNPQHSNLNGVRLELTLFDNLLDQIEDKHFILEGLSVHLGHRAVDGESRILSLLANAIDIDAHEFVVLNY